MRKFLTFAVTTAVLAVSAPAFAQDAQCPLTESANSMTVGGLIGSAAGDPVSAAVVADGLVNRMFGDPQMAQAFGSCSPQQVRDRLMQMNRWENTMTLARDVSFRFPVPDRAVNVAADSPPADQPATVVEQQQPAPQVAAPPPAPVVASPPSVRRVEVRPLPAQVNLSEVRASLAALRAEDARLRQELAGIPTSQLTAEQLQLLNTLALIPNWEAKLRNLPENGVVQTASLPAEQQAVVQQVVATEGLVESYVDRDWLDLMSILGFLGVIALATFVIWFLRGRIKAVEGNVAALGKRVTATENKVVELDERQFEHSVQKIADGEQRTLLPAEIKRMKDGQRFDYHLMVDGKVASYTGTITNRTASGDALVMVTEIGKPVTAKQLFAELCKRIEAGETVPYLREAA